MPQRSVIGPEMFLFYINDLPDNLRPFIRIFSDDTVDYNSASNHSTPQENPAKLEQWEHSRDMDFPPLSASTLSSHEGDNQLRETFTYMTL